MRCFLANCSLVSLNIIQSNARFEISKSNHYIVTCHALDEIAKKMSVVLFGFYENRKEKDGHLCSRTISADRTEKEPNYL